MGTEASFSKTKAIAEMFALNGEVISCEAHGNGHINDTFKVVCRSSDGINSSSTTDYILQRINHEVFKNPEQLMENISRVTEYLKCKIREDGGDENRETLNIIMTHDNKLFFKDSDGTFWRMYLFIEDVLSLEQVRTPKDFYESAYLFGKFQKLLADFDASALAETIPNFHNTPMRFETFLRAVDEDVCHRADECRHEIEFLINRKDDMAICQTNLEEGKLPLRVTHNDTKLSNILLDSHSGKGVCIVDLDTVMPGLSVFDFGDAIRFGANTAAEDETDLTKVALDLELFSQFTDGYIKGCDGSLTDFEIQMLPHGAKIMTLECGMRFLTDYLQGDTYFKIHREKHNLDRARNQLALVADMERKWEELEKIVAR